MALRAVRLRPDAEKALSRIVRATGMTVSGALNQGLLVFSERLAEYEAVIPHEVYRTLDLGPGGYAIAPSTQTRRGVRRALRKKLGRSR